MGFLGWYVLVTAYYGTWFISSSNELPAPDAPPLACFTLPLIITLVILLTLPQTYVGIRNGISSAVVFNSLAHIIVGFILKISFVDIVIQTFAMIPAFIYMIDFFAN